MKKLEINGHLIEILVVDFQSQEKVFEIQKEVNNRKPFSVVFKQGLLLFCYLFLVMAIRLRQHTR